MFNRGKNKQLPSKPVSSSDPEEEEELESSEEQGSEESESVEGEGMLLLTVLSPGRKKNQKLKELDNREYHVETGELADLRQQQV